jgi:hypothetical protein
LPRHWMPGWKPKRLCWWRLSQNSGDACSFEVSLPPFTAIGRRSFCQCRASLWSTRVNTGGHARFSHRCTDALNLVDWWVTPDRPIRLNHCAGACTSIRLCLWTGLDLNALRSFKFPRWEAVLMYAILNRPTAGKMSLYRVWLFLNRLKINFVFS